MTHRALTFAALLALLLPSAASAQLPEDDRVAEAFLAWDRGEYVDALEGYLEVLNGPDGADFVREIAELTGEVYQVTELTPDGDDFTIGPRGRYVSYETAGGTRVVDLANGGEEVAFLEGDAATVSPSGFVAYYVVADDPEIEAARRTADDARSRGRRAYFQALGEVRWLEAQATELRVRNLVTGDETTPDTGEWVLGEMVYATDTEDLFVVAGRPDEPDRNEILRLSDGEISVVPTGPGYKDDPVPAAGGRYLVYSAPGERPVPAAPGTAQAPPARRGVGVVELATGREAFLDGAADVSVAADGSRLAWMGERDGVATIESAPLDVVELARTGGVSVVETEMDVERPAVSPDGSWIAYQKRLIHDWELFAVPADGSGEELQLSREIQHDQFPLWIDENTVLAAKGEGRHRRAFLYELEERPDPLKLFDNNQVRTIAPEYQWGASPDGSAVVIQAERDGDTVSPERGVYAVHLDRPVTRDQLRARLEENLAAEKELRAFGERMFASIAEKVRPVTERVDLGRIYQYAKVLHDFDSKYITEPGNRLAGEYIARKLRDFGYEPELQWFEPRPGVRTANVIARLPGTVDPDLVYAVSSHYDSTRRGPGADDDTSATTALLEAARVMKDHPQAATIEFAFFTGEEAGLLGSREYVRRAVEGGKRIVGALNNDMVGWANNHRLDNTIRYSNPGIRDIQHNAAMMFSDLITYDALYYKSTDAAAYYEAYGDIVGGIGSYPVLGSPHYHQFTDRLVTIDQRLVRAVSRTTVGTLMLLASSPSRVSDLTLTAVSGGVEARWSASPESDIDHYLVAWTDGSGEARTIRVTDGTSHTVRGIQPGSLVKVKAVNERGMEGWDWARAEVTGQQDGS